ncbi:MAG: D-lyxose/D-mannose family sugar isomerase [Treponema sp.]|jgi:D-lyxose ketol-isomerase|nr:D-lyxose/D-mannose family sugar isomerase [Treponema sp.]
MKRSEINAAIKKMEALLREHRFLLPGFCSWTPGDWKTRGREYDEIRDTMLGWDVTDFGGGKFNEIGLVLVTIRNGNTKNKAYTKTYAEKVIMVEEGQFCPYHFHWKKMEDIINRGGGNVVFKLYNAAKDGQRETTDVEINQDGRKYTVKAGQEIILLPGESLTLYPYSYHEFTAQRGTGTALIGEVSMCNDDKEDNRFYEQMGRFPAIEEDEAPHRLLCSEYGAAT